MKILLAGMLTITLTACASTGGLKSSKCSPNVFDDNGYPCWVNNKPEDGIVLSMAEHVDPNKTREVLFKKALIELAAGKSGVDVSEDAIVKKQTLVTGDDNVKQKAQVVSLATVKTANGSVTVKAKIHDSWKDPQTSKVYMWVISEN